MLTQAEKSWCDYCRCHRPQVQRPAVDPTPDLASSAVGRRNAEEAFGLTAASDVPARLRSGGEEESCC